MPEASRPTTTQPGRVMGAAQQAIVLINRP
jgi:hypothetical protein